MLNFTINLTPGIPIYEQIIYAVKKALVLGQLNPGDPFPSVRELSRELKINPLTAQKAVSQLIQAKLLEVNLGIGCVVSGGREASAEQKEQILQTQIEHLVIESKQLSIKKKELIDSINHHWKMEG
jgi:GntR family transcriptional regulator